MSEISAASPILSYSEVYYAKQNEQDYKAFVSAGDQRPECAVGRLARKDGGPVVLDTDHGPPIGLSLAERLLRTRGVVELALGVVMQEEEPQCRPVGVVGELEHRRVAIRVAGREQRASADPVPDPHRLLRAVVEVVGLGLVG
jgi:hypothetical protein